MQLEFPNQIFEKYSNIEFHENAFSGSRAVQCEWADRDREIGLTGRHMTRVTVAFHNFANAPEKKNTHFVYVAMYIYTYIKQGNYECTEIAIGR